MDYVDYLWGLYRGYCRDPFPPSLLRTRQSRSYVLRAIGVSEDLAHTCGARAFCFFQLAEPRDDNNGGGFRGLGWRV